MGGLKRGAVIAFALVAGCGGSGADDESAIEDTVRAWLDTDSCDMATQEFLDRTAVGGAEGEDAVRQCEESAIRYPGLEAGEYEITSVTVDGDLGRAEVVPDKGPSRVYLMENQGGEWLVDGFATQGGTGGGGGSPGKKAAE